MRLETVRPLLIPALLALALAAPAQAQFARQRIANPLAGAPAGTPPAEAEIWPFPPPDPKAWWDEPRPKSLEAADPLGGRRIRRGERLTPVDSGVDPSSYRLWGLAPLQWQLLRGDELILEVWVRPAGTVRQAVARIVVRGDGKAFVEARAGLACCEAGIGRRMGFDAEAPEGAAAAFQGLRTHPMWDAPHAVRVSEGPEVTSTVCLEGVAYDVTLLTQGRSRTLHRACEDAEVGQIADVLEPIVRAALGHDPRFDLLFPRGADFSAAKRAYEALVQGGGALRPDPDARPRPADGAPLPEAP